MAAGKRKPPARDAPPKREPKMVASPAFRTKPPKKIVIRDPLPEIPADTIPVLRKKPITIRDPDAPKKSAKPKAPRPLKPGLPPGSGDTTVVTKMPAEQDWAPPETLRKTFAIKPPEPDPVETPAPRPRARPAEAKQARAPAAAPTYTEIRKRAITLTGIVGASVLVASLFCLILFAATPWVQATPQNVVGPSPVSQFEEGSLGSDELASDPFSNVYIQRLVNWPFAAFLFSSLVGLVLLLIDEVPKMRADHHRSLQSVGLAVLTYAGFVHILAAARWIGLYVGSLFDAGPTPLHILVFPYLVLVFGTAQTIVCALLLTTKLRRYVVLNVKGRIPMDDLRLPTRTAIVAAIGLLVSALVPMAVQATDEGRAVIQEAELESNPSGDPDLGAAADTYGLARGLLWLILYAALLDGCIALAERANPRPLLHTLFLLVYASTGLLILSALITTILANVSLGGANDVVAAVFAPMYIVLVALGFLYVMFVRRSLLPKARQAVANLND